MANEKKRKINEEHRNFNEKWEIKYFFIENKSKPICLICNENIAVCKEYNLKRHYETQHSKHYAHLSGEIRKNKLLGLKENLKKQQLLFVKQSDENELIVKASYIISEKIAKASKPFSEVEFLKDCMIAAADTICPKMRNTFANLSLSRRTVTERCEEIANNLSLQLYKKSEEFVVFSLALDESVDITDVSQLAIFIRGVNDNFEVTEELLDLVPLHSTTKAEDIFSGLKSAIEKSQVNWEKLVSVTTDGAPAMIGEKNGLKMLIQNKMKEHKSNQNVLHYHCIIHQEALCAKVLSFDHVMKIVIKTVNYIRSRALIHRQFQTFLEEVNASYGEIIYFTEIRWLSRGNVLKRFFELRNEIKKFMIEKGKPIAELTNYEWLFDLAFLVDITSHLNDLNIKLQGKNQLITEMMGHVRAFELKLQLWKQQIREHKLFHFPTCSIIKNESKINLNGSYQLYCSQLEILSKKFSQRFSDFRQNNFSLRIFSNPFAINVSSVPEEMQMEIIELQSNSSLESNFLNKDILGFYKYLPCSFLKLRENALRIISMFGSTYLCEKFFSSLKNTKTKLRSRLTDENLKASLKICVNQCFTPDFDKLVKKKQLHVSH